MDIKSSYYEPETLSIGFWYHDWMLNELAWYKFINDVDHEITHHILNRLVGIEASVTYDNIFECSLNPHIHIGYKNIDNLLIVNTLFDIRRKSSLMVYRENPYIHYEVHYKDTVEFIRISGNKILITGRSKVENA